MRSSFLRISTVVPLLAATLLAGCGTLDVPRADNYPATGQKKARAVHHWDVLAWNCRSRHEVDAVMAFALGKGATQLKPARATDYGGYGGYFADPDGHVWEAVVAPGIEVGDDRRVHLPD